jgi:hypothetical protein
VVINRRVASGCENELSEIASRMPIESTAADRASPVSKGAALQMCFGDNPRIEKAVTSQSAARVLLA